MNIDVKHMRRAFVLAGKAMGFTSPNPMVGCVIVKDGRKIAEGWHQFCGGDHAEVDALKKAGDAARGATMYVTLEPCAHWGKTPPCVDAVLKAGIRRVVVAMQDPDPRTCGRSIRKLRARGVDVVLGVCEPEARQMNAAFIKNIMTGMPYIVAKTAQSMDGKVGTRSGKVRWITSERTRMQAKKRRAGFDAIIAGVNTVLSDDPGLNAPGKEFIKVVVDSTLRMPLDAKVLKGMAAGQVLLATTSRANADRMATLWKKGVRVMVCPARRGKVDLKAMFKTLAKNGLIRILIEGGPTLIRAALKAGLVDRMHVYIAPKLMGDSADVVAGVNVGEMLGKGILNVVAVERLGRDILIEADVI